MDVNGGRRCKLIENLLFSGYGFARIVIADFEKINMYLI